MTLIQRINPINKEAEKQKFFFDPNYNPQFEYAQSVLPHELHYYTPISDEYLGIAQKILEHIHKTYGSHDEYLETVREKLLTREETEQLIREYLTKEQLEKNVTVKFSPEAVARTSMFMNVLTVRLPIEYSHSGLMGMLYHDVGTHLFRSMNDRRQVWYGQREKFRLHPYLVTEEGLAVLHASLPKKEGDTLLRRQALYYFSVWFAHTHSFAELNRVLKKYVPDRERRWEFCLRCKRGIKDTSQPGAFSKDQTYFAGAVKVWRWLKKHDFDAHPLFMGKIGYEDVDTLRSIATTENLRTPRFLEDKELYKEKITRVGINNFFEQSTHS